MTTRHTHLPHARVRAVASLVLALIFALLPAAAAVVPRAQAQDNARRPAATSTRGNRGGAQTSSSDRRSAATAATATTAPRPRLVLFIAIDQFRYDYLERFGDLFAVNGFRRLLRDGASWTQANYDHTPTETAPGHATMMTGTWPSETGIVGNDWFERSEEGDKGRRVNNVEDERAKLLGGGGANERAATPRRLLVSTVGDELRLATNGRSKVVGVSLKDRSAILPAGRQATAAYWYSPETGRFVSSDYYFEQMPAWVSRFNDARPADAYRNKAWERLLPNESEYLRRAGADDPEWEWKQNGGDKSVSTFPHRMPDTLDRKLYDAIQYSPFFHDMLVRFAGEAITNESLGADADTDVLTVSFSSNDYVGHRFGPYSQETMDMTLTLDRQIGELLDIVDRRVGLKNTLVALTGDHGVAPVPEHAAELKLPGRRVKPKDIETKVREALKESFKRAGDAERGGDYFLDYTPKNGNIFFNLAALRRDGVSREEAERVAGEAALKVAGVARYFTRTQLERGAVSPADAVARRVLHGFNSKRSGDLVVITEPFVLVVTYTADHFSPYSYDTHVPVIIMGGGVAPGTYTQAATPADIAPTLSALLRVQPPSNATGRVLLEALR